MLSMKIDGLLFLCGIHWLTVYQAGGALLFIVAMLG